MKNKNISVLISGPGDLPGFQLGEKRGLFLNLRLDVEMDGVTYHLRSEFAECGRLSEVIDAVELERSRMQTA